MKFLSTLRNRLRKNLIKNQSGQGATEYILLLVVVVGLVVAFKKPITDAIKSKTTALESKMEEVQ
jgi:Flp pilus assembly pilin Flp